jgi:ferredoxin--NADP+ reductase
MTYVIAGDCCSDASCVAVCPMNSIHPSPGEAGFGTTDGLFVDPRSCIDCGACADVCPVGAAKPADAASPVEVELNRSYFAERPELDGLDLDAWEPPRFSPWRDGPRRVAVVGAGPAGMYATRELLLRSTAEVTLYDRLPVVGGLARFGVAPDHPLTKQIVSTFERVVEHPRVRWRPGTEAVTSELESRYDAVVHAVGSFASRRLAIPGEDAERSCSAAEMVAWYNDRPGAELPVELVGPRAVIVGNGNVALDLARLLISDNRRLAGLHLPSAVRDALANSGITEVVILGRRGPEAAAYSGSAFRDLLTLDGVEVVDQSDLANPSALRAERLKVAGERGSEILLRGLRGRPVELSSPPQPGRRIVLRFNTTPSVWDPAVGLGVDGLMISAGNLFTAIGFVGRPVPGLPFDGLRGVVPNERGAVAGRPAHFVTGWIKRGARGGIGANKACAEETVRTLLAAGDTTLM